MGIVEIRDIILFLNKELTEKYKRAIIDKGEIMGKKYEISEERLKELRQARRENRDKRVDRRLHALILHAEGNTGKSVNANVKL